MSGIPQGSVLGLALFNILSVTWAVGLSALSASLPTTPSCVVWLTLCRRSDVIQTDLDGLER